MLSDIAHLFAMADLEEVERNSTSERGVFRGRRVFMVKGEYANALENALLGYPLGNQQGIFWVKADPWPDRLDAVCRAVEIAGAGRVDGIGRDSIRYGRARIVATYSNQIDAFTNPNQQDGQPGVGAAVETIVAEVSIASQFINVSKLGLRFKNSTNPIPPDVSPTAMLRRAEIVVPVNNSQVTPFKFLPYIGRLNSTQIFGRDPKTVLYLGPRSTQKRITVPYVQPPATSSIPPRVIDLYDYVHTFQHQDVGYERFVDPKSTLPDKFDELEWTDPSVSPFQPYGAPIDLNRIFEVNP